MATKEIWKFNIGPGQGPTVMPKGAQILCVQNQREKACIWALIDPNETEEEKRYFWIIGTGHGFAYDEDKHVYIGTFQLDGGLLVYHVFEYTKGKNK